MDVGVELTDVVGVVVDVDVGVVVAVVVGVVTSQPAKAPCMKDSVARFSSLTAFRQSFAELALIRSSRVQLSSTSTLPLENSTITLFSTSSVSVQLSVFVSAVFLFPAETKISTPHSIAVSGPPHALDIWLIRFACASQTSGEVIVK